MDSLFPYNPEFWYLLPVSVIINWCFYTKDDEDYRWSGVSNDLLAACAYPIFAVIDALIYGIGMLGTEYQALAISCPRNPKADLKCFAKFNNTQLDLHDIPPDIVSLGQRAINIAGPLPACYMFAAVMFVGVLVDLSLWDELHWRPKEWVRRLAYATYGYAIILLTISHLSLGDFVISMILRFYEAMLPYLLFTLFGLCLFVSVSFAAAMVILIGSVVDRDKAKMLDAFKGLGSCLVPASPLGIIILSVYVTGVPLVPDLAVSVGERDQIAALMGGSDRFVYSWSGVSSVQGS